MTAAATTEDMGAVEVVMHATHNGTLATAQQSTRLVELRHAAVARALRMLVDGSGPGMASAVLIASVLGSQARTAGIRLPVSEVVR